MALYMNGQEISQSSGVPIVVEGLTEINEGTPSNISGLVKGNGSTLQAAQAGMDYQAPLTAGVDYMVPPTTATTLPASGTALTNNTIYHVTDAVTTYNFVGPASGWTHGYFATGTSASVSFSGTFVGAAPSIEGNKAYEFDVFDGIWAVQEVVNA